VLPSDLVGFVRGALPPPPARVLEVGAGDGELAAVLAGAGYEVVAIDPQPGSPDVRRVALHELDEAPFDAAVAVVSLHHVEPLDESCERLGRLVREGGRLVVDEFDVEQFDVRAARWWLEHQDDDRSEPAELIAGHRRHLHSVARVREALSPWFDVGPAVPGPYLYRWKMPPDTRATEERLIAEGRIPAVGARFVSRRVASGGGPPRRPAR